MKVEWTVEVTDSSITVTHEGTGHSFIFMRLGEAPYVSGSPTVRYADDAHKPPDHFMDEAFQLAFDHARDAWS